MDGDFLINLKFEELKNEVSKIINGEGNYNVEDMLELIKSNNFLGQINEDEAGYLISMLPMDTSVIGDDGKSSYDKISRKTGGIGLDNIEYGIKGLDEYDEWDEIQPDKKIKKTGFAAMINNDNEDDEIDPDDLDFLIDLESD